MLKFNFQILNPYEYLLNSRIQVLIRFTYPSFMSGSAKQQNPIAVIYALSLARIKSDEKNICAFLSVCPNFYSDL